ncbi:MAG: DUF5989 family protein [Deltaproteobacteria bacterium]|jgi:hypothetical protein
MAGKSESDGGLIAFLWRNKIWWLTPAVAVLLLTGLLLWFGRSSATSPFTYTLF